MKATAVILCAGAGRRLGGVCKALLSHPADGQSFLWHVSFAARDAGCEDVVVVIADPHGQAVEATLPDWTRAVWNPLPERGMASSIACGLSAALPSEIALVWPVDHAFATVASARAVLAAAGPARIVIPTFEYRGGHPAAFGRELWDELDAAADLPEGARSVIHKDPTRVVRLPVEDPGVVRDVDLPGDLG